MKLVPNHQNSKVAQINSLCYNHFKSIFHEKFPGMEGEGLDCSSVKVDIGRSFAALGEGGGGRQQAGRLRGRHGRMAALVM